MNVYEAMRVVRNEFVPHTIDAHLAMDEIEDVVDAYAELAPDWDKLSKLYEHVALPLGIDWRLCKWQRPEVMP